MSIRDWLLSASANLLTKGSNCVRHDFPLRNPCCIVAKLPLEKEAPLFASFFASFLPQRLFFKEAVFGIKNWPEMPKMARNGQKWHKNGTKIEKMAKNAANKARKRPGKGKKMPKTAKTDTLLIHKFEFCGNVRNRIPKIFELAKTSYLCGQFKKNQRCKLHLDPGKLLEVMGLFTFSDPLFRTFFPVPVFTGFASSERLF